MITIWALLILIGMICLISFAIFLIFGNEKRQFLFISTFGIGLTILLVVILFLAFKNKY